MKILYFPSKTIITMIVKGEIIVDSRNDTFVFPGYVWSSIVLLRGFLTMIPQEVQSNNEWPGSVLNFISLYYIWVVVILYPANQNKMKLHYYYYLFFEVKTLMNLALFRLTIRYYTDANIHSTRRIGDDNHHNKLTRSKKRTN